MTIVEELRQNKESGAKRLESEYKAGLMSLARRFCDDPSDAEELVNRTFAAVVEGIDDYLEQSAFFGWMCQILTNLHGMDVRRKANRDIIYPGDVPDLPDETATDRIYDDIDASLLRDTIQRLPKEQRELLLLHYFMDMPIAKIAKFLSIPSGTVRSRLYYARKALAAKLGVAAHKPGVKTLLIVLVLCGLTALGAAVYRLGWGEPSRRADNVSTTPTSSQAGISGISGISGTSGTSGASGVTGVSRITGVSNGNAPLNFQLFNLSTEPPTQGDNTMNTRKFLASAAAIAATAGASLTASADTLYLTAEDKNGKSSFTAWNASAASPGGEPSRDHDYVNKLGKVIRTPTSGDSATFNGQSLTLGSFSENKEGRVALCRNGNFTVHFANEGLFLEQGRIVPYVAARQYTFEGTITATAPKGYPFVFQIADTSSHLAMTNVLAATVKGGTDTEFAFANAVSNPNGYLILNPAANTTFTGTLTIGKTTGRLVYNYPVRAEYRSTRTWPGTIHVTEGSLLRAQYASTQWTIGSLVLDSGATLHLRANGDSFSTITLTESLDVAKGAILDIGGAPGESDKTARQWVVMTLPQDKGTIPVENFTLSGVPSFPAALPKYTLETNAVGDIWQLVLKKTAHDYLQTNDDKGGYSAAAEVSSAMTTDASWAGGTAPSAGCDYVAQKDKGGLTAYPIIRTPYQSEQYDFPGDSLILGSGGQLLPCSKEVAFPLLVLSANAAYILSLPGNGTHLRGAIQTVGGSDTYPQKIQAYMSGLNTVDADISGNGAIWVTGRNSSTNPYGDIEFTAFNTNFTGKIKVCAVGPTETSDANPPSDSEYSHERLFVTDARNLGGPLDEFRADALELADYSVLEARNDVDLNVANRGVKVTGNAGFAAPENVTLAISNDVTWNGTARKTGAGTLALGGKPRIASGATAELAIDEGFLQARSTNAVNGVSVSFTDGAYLLVDPAPTDTYLAQFGAVDLSDNPFGGDLPVAFDLPALANESDSYRYADIAVATVKDAATASDLNLSAKKIKGHTVTFTYRTNNDDTVTILASIGQNAFIMVVR